MNASTLIDLLPYLEALDGDTLEDNLLRQGEAMEELLASLEPSDPAQCWAYSIEPLLTLLRNHGAPAMVDAILRLGPCCDIYPLRQLLRREQQRRDLALYQAQICWLISAQLHTLLSGGPFEVPDAVEGVSL